jgi:hypothetical protein
MTLRAVDHLPVFKVRAAMEAIRGEKAMAKITPHHKCYQNKVTNWKTSDTEECGGTIRSELHSADRRHDYA